MPSNIIDLQREDHARLDRWMKRYPSCEARARVGVMRDIVALVTTHAFAEEEVLFPTARRVLGDTGETITSAIEGRHQRVNDLLKSMESMQPGDDAFDASVDELFPLLVEDLRIEEDQLLPALTTRLDARALERLGQTWLAAKRVAPNRSHPRVPRRPPWNVLAGIPLAVWDRLRSYFAPRSAAR